MSDYHSYGDTTQLNAYIKSQEQEIKRLRAEYAFPEKLKEENKSLTKELKVVQDKYDNLNRGYSVRIEKCDTLEKENARLNRGIEAAMDKYMLLEDKLNDSTADILDISHENRISIPLADWEQYNLEKTRSKAPIRRLLPVCSVGSLVLLVLDIACRFLVPHVAAIPPAIGGGGGGGGSLLLYGNTSGQKTITVGQGLTIN